jgi:serine beta-lactamase-like protein LACTB
MAVLARLWEEGRVELDQSVSHYLPTWPDKLVDGQPVNITLRQLCSHLGGIRCEHQSHIAECC